MRAVAYSVMPPEKEPLSRANQKKHDITLISNALTLETSVYARGKDVVIVYVSDDVSAAVIDHLADMGIKYIATRSEATDHIDREAAGKRNIRIANVPGPGPSMPPHGVTDIALKTISNIDKWQENKCVGSACACANNCRVAGTTDAS